VDVEILLRDSINWLCTEDFLVANAFSDQYYYYFRKGSHKFTITYAQTNEVIDILKNGIRFFMFCADATSVFTSTLESMFLFTGGVGKSEYLPVFGSQISQTEMDLNTLYVQSFM